MYPPVPTLRRASPIEMKIRPESILIPFASIDFCTASSSSEYQSLFLRATSFFGAVFLRFRFFLPPSPVLSPTTSFFGSSVPSAGDAGLTFFFLRVAGSGGGIGVPPTAVTLSAKGFPSSSFPISNSISKPSRCDMVTTIRTREFD